MTPEHATDAPTAITNTTYTVDVRFTVRPRAGADPMLQDSYGICDLVGQWLQELTLGCRRDGLEMEGGQVRVAPGTARMWADAGDSGRKSPSRKRKPR